MSIAAQEQALLDLLFSRHLREQFAREPADVLRHYALTPAEQADFIAIRPDALAFDAQLRSAILLAAIAKVLPLTFAGLSSYPDGVERLRDVLDAALVRAAPIDRPVQFADSLREDWDLWPFGSARDSALMQAILDAEWGMASTAVTRRQHALTGLPEEPAAPVLRADWLALPVQLAPFTSAGILPQSYTDLKAAWCAGEEAALWRRLQKTPLSPEARQAQLHTLQPRLLLARAVVTVPSACDPVIEHRTTELPEGFAALFQHVNGEHSVQQLLAGLQQAGAPAEMLTGVQAGFQQLLESGLLAQPAA